MLLKFNNLNDLRESFDYILKDNDQVQYDVKMAVKSEDYAKAVKAIDNYVQIVDGFIQKAHNIAQNYGDKANYVNQTICLKALKMAEEIITAHLEVEENVIKRYIK